MQNLNIGDYVLITDRDNRYYLQIGEIRNLSSYRNSIGTLYEVLFKVPVTHNGVTTFTKELHTFGTDLAERCKALLFKEN